MNNFNELYKDICNNVLVNGKISSPRGKEIIELIGSQFELTNPKHSLCTLKERKLNYAFAIIEMFEYVYGESNPERICFYNSNMRNFLNENTNYFDGAYGPRIKDQLEFCYNLLKKDPDSRQAIITIRDSRDIKDTKDFPCTLSLQFLLRENKLNLIATMRSNDLLWGTPYDVHGFTFIQKCLANWLNVELGTYIHQAGSLHIYIETKDKYSFLDSNEILDIELPEIKLSKEETLKQIEIFFENEKQAREEQIYTNKGLNEILIPYWDIIENYIKKKYDK